MKCWQVQHDKPSKDATNWLWLHLDGNVAEISRWKTRSPTNTCTIQLFTGRPHLYNQMFYDLWPCPGYRRSRELVLDEASPCMGGHSWPLNGHCKPPEQDILGIKINLAHFLLKMYFGSSWGLYPLSPYIGVDGRPMVRPGPDLQKILTIVVRLFQDYRKMILRFL